MPCCRIRFCLRRAKTFPPISWFWLVSERYRTAAKLDKPPDIITSTPIWLRDGRLVEVQNTMTNTRQLARIISRRDTQYAVSFVSITDACISTIPALPRDTLGTKTDVCPCGSKKPRQTCIHQSCSGCTNQIKNIEWIDAVLINPPPPDVHHTWHTQTRPGDVIQHLHNGRWTCHTVSALGLIADISSLGTPQQDPLQLITSNYRPNWQYDQATWSYTCNNTLHTGHQRPAIDDTLVKHLWPARTSPFQRQPRSSPGVGYTRMSMESANAARDTIVLHTCSS